MNELRETFHHCVRTLVLPFEDGALSPALPHRPATAWRAAPSHPAPADLREARDVWEEAESDVKALLRGVAAKLTADLSAELARRYEEELESERERFQSRQGELSRLIEQQSLTTLEKEIERLTAELEQGNLFLTEAAELAELSRSAQAKEEELRRRRAHYDELREQLTRDRERVLKHLLPRRYALRGSAQVFPVAVEIRLAEIST